MDGEVRRLTREADVDTQSVPITVLHVDDDPTMTELVATALPRFDEALTVVSEVEPARALERVQTGERIDCVLSDYDMPDLDGLELLSAVRESHPRLPFVLLTARGSEAVASEAISQGVTDYVQKSLGTDSFELLAKRIHNAVSEVRAARALEWSERRLSLLFEQSPMGVIEWDLDTRAVRWNRQAEEIFGWSAEEALGRRAEFIVPPEAREHVDGLFEQLAGQTGGEESVNRNVRRDGTEIVCHWHNRAIVEDGEAIGVLALVSDVTGRMEPEGDLDALANAGGDDARTD